MTAQQAATLADENLRRERVDNQLADAMGTWRDTDSDDGERLVAGFAVLLADLEA